MSTTVADSMRAPGELAQRLAAGLSPGSVVRAHEPLAKRTTLRVGGPADLYVEPANEADLAAALQFAQAEALPVFVLGRGSNLLVRDGGVRGLVLCLAQPHFARVEVAGDRLICGAGARLKAVAIEAKRHGLAGLEFLEGIPGSVGGALRMNAGAYGSEMFRVVVSLCCLDYTGAVQELAVADVPSLYRSCPFFKTHIAVSAVLQGQGSERSAVEARMNEFSQKRWASQPAAPSAGCMFKNPAAIPAGRLVDELGLKGTRVGGARVSHEHGNFIVNDGTATAADVLGLIELVKAKARAERGIELETEVQIIGDGV